MANQIDYRRSIPVGSDLRVLLNSELISYGTIQEIVKSKGIFVGISDKAVTVPLLCSTILTPTEFTQLMEDSVGREQRPKTKVSDLKLVLPNSDWVTPLKEIFSDDSFVLQNLGEIELVRRPSIVVKGRNQVEIPYSIVRKDISKDWIHREINFDGSILIHEIDGQLKLEFVSNHTSKETDQINRKILSRIAKELKYQNLISSEILSNIEFGSFTNPERLRFFKRLVAGNGTSIGIEVTRDGILLQLPDDPIISWMSDAVRWLKIDGSRLNDIFLISNEKYYDYYYIVRMDVTYPFCIGTNNGKVKVSYYFYSSIADQAREKHELVSEIGKIVCSPRLNQDAEKYVRAHLEKDTRSIIDAQYEGIKNERTPLNTIQAASAGLAGET